MTEEITSPERTIMMQVVENLNKGIFPPEYPTDGFLTSENLLALVDAINYNKTAPLLLNYTLYFYEQDVFFEVQYMPFDMYNNAFLISSNFVFTIDNIDFYGSVSLSNKQKKANEMNFIHNFLHQNSYDTYYLKSPEGKFYSGVYTKTNHHEKPIELKTKILNYRPNKISYHDVFNIPKPIDTQVTQTDRPFYERDVPVYAFDTGQRLIQSDYVIKWSNMKDFKVASVVNDISFGNPHYGYIDHHEITPFWGGGETTEWKNNHTFGSSLGFNTQYTEIKIGNSRHNPYTSLLYGHLIYRGFDVVDITDTTFAIRRKYLLVYRNRGFDENIYDPTLCCLAQCFGITE